MSIGTISITKRATGFYIYIYIYIYTHTHTHTHTHIYICTNKVGSSELSDKASDFTEFAKVKYYVKEDLLEILLVSYSTQK